MENNVKSLKMNVHSFIDHGKTADTPFSPWRSRNGIMHNFSLQKRKNGEVP